MLNHFLKLLKMQFIGVWGMCSVILFKFGQLWRYTIWSACASGCTLCSSISICTSCTDTSMIGNLCDTVSSPCNAISIYNGATCELCTIYNPHCINCDVSGCLLCESGYILNTGICDSIFFTRLSFKL